MKLHRKDRMEVKQIFYESKFALYGKRYKPKEFYQICYGFNGLPPLYYNFKKKPLFRNLLVLDWLLFLPYILFLLCIGIYASIIGILKSLFYVTIKCYKHAWDDFGWSGNYLLPTIIFWQVISIILAYLYFNEIYL